MPFVRTSYASQWIFLGNEIFLGTEDEEIVYRSCLNNAGVGDECLNLDHDEVCT